MSLPTLPPLRIARCRFFATAMIGAYLIINALLALLGPWTAEWPIAGTTALLVPPMVLAMIHVVIPLAKRMERRP